LNPLAFEVSIFIQHPKCRREFSGSQCAPTLPSSQDVHFHSNDKIINVFTLYLLKRQVHEVKYSELVNSGATETELQEQLVGGDMTTITMRIPRNLKEAGAEAAALKGISFSAFIRMCMIEELTKKGQ